ncbi:MAG: Lipoprotein signal peptidase [Chlamydiia bacterium]|nr:Lipoprotein signal peptidase [Chlamydiia bacterium]
MHKPRVMHLFLPIFMIVTSVDVLSKRLVYECFGNRSFDRIPIFLDLVGFDGFINFVENRGGAWGVFSEYHQYLLMFRVAVVFAMFCYMVFSEYSLVRTLSMSLVIAGAFGNILDCLIYGFVIDMIQITFGGYSFPVFNFADMAIFLGAVGLLMYIFLKRDEKPIQSERQYRNSHHSGD